MYRPFKLYQNAKGQWGWACRVCPHLDRFGMRVEGRVCQGGFKTITEAGLAFEKHCRAPSHVACVEADRLLDEYVTRVLRVFRIEEGDL